MDMVAEVVVEVMAAEVVAVARMVEVVVRTGEVAARTDEEVEEAAEEEVTTAIQAEDVGTTMVVGTAPGMAIHTTRAAEGLITGGVQRAAEEATREGAPREAVEDIAATATMAAHIDKAEAVVEDLIMGGRHLESCACSAFRPIAKMYTSTTL